MLHQGKARSDEITVFLPLRRGSERVPRKNMREFAGFSNGLLEIKLRQLSASKLVDRVLISTDDREALEYACSVKASSNFDLIIDERPASLASSQTTTDELIKYVPVIMDEGHVFWTHVTSPFFASSQIDASIQEYLSLTEEFDSLMGVESLQDFLWQAGKPLNYSPAEDGWWPRTQTLPKVDKINNAVFIAPLSTYVDSGNRVGLRPFLKEFSFIEGFDIDWQPDFDLAQLMWNHFGTL